MVAAERLGRNGVEGHSSCLQGDFATSGPLSSIQSLARASEGLEGYFKGNSNNTKIRKEKRKSSRRRSSWGSISAFRLFGVLAAILFLELQDLAYSVNC